MTLRQGQLLSFDTPGGGGMYAPAEREPAALQRDLRDEVVSANAAQRDYGLSAAQATAALAAGRATK